MVKLMFAVEVVTVAVDVQTFDEDMQTFVQFSVQCCSLAVVLVVSKDASSLRRAEANTSLP